MRNLMYELSDGTIVTTLELTGGQPFKVILAEIKEQKPEPTPIVKAMLEQFGYVSPMLLDKVIL